MRSVMMVLGLVAAMLSGYVALPTQHAGRESADRQIKRRTSPLHGRENQDRHGE